MKRLQIVSAVLCLSLLFAGCTFNQDAPANESQTKVTEEEVTAHKVVVEDYTNTILEDSTGEYVSRYPKLIVDGKEAIDINDSLIRHIQSDYPMEKEDDYVYGYQTYYKWGVKDNVVSIIIYASYISEDFYTTEIYNYDLDTLEAMEDREVTEVLGLTDNQLFDRTAEVYKNYCSDLAAFDLDKSIAGISYDTITPFVTPDGKPGVAGSIVYSQDSQFGGMECLKCFDIETMEVV